MFERFTERARQVVVLAQEDARALKHNYIGTEHLLLGIVREGQGLGARVLESLGLRAEDVRGSVARIVGVGDEAATTGQIPFTPRAKKVLELAAQEANALGHHYVGTEHLLLGIVRENSGVAAQILADFHAPADVVRSAVLAELSGTPLSRDTSTSVMSFSVPAPGRDWLPTLVAGVFLAVGLAVGLLIGWAVWG